MKSAIKLGMGVATFVVVLGLAGSLFGWLPSIISLNNPFRTEEVERVHPALLDTLTDVSEYTGATGTFSAIVDLEKDVRFVPSALAGERSKMLAAGSVDATVDFSGLTDGAIDVRPDDTVVVTLPPVELSEVAIDHSATEVVSRDRGILDRIGGVLTDSPTSDKDLLVAAESRLTEAAATSELRDRAEANTRRMLEELLGQLGYDDVLVRFDAPLELAAAGS